MATKKEARVYSFQYRFKKDGEWIIANSKKTDLGRYWPEAVSVYWDDEKGNRLCATAFALSKQANEAAQYFKGVQGPETIRVIPLPANAVTGNGENAAEYFETQNGWKTREAERFKTGEYTPLPWANEKWYIEGEKGLNLFAHVSRKNPKKIAFVESPDKGTLDRHTVMNPGTFLSRFNAYFGLTPTQIAQWVVTYSQKHGSDERLLEIAETEEQVRWVYENGPNSCMSHKAEEYASWYNGKKYHPTSVYASGDCGVAYIRDADDEECVTARVVVNLKDNKYTRVYGDSQRLKPLLAAAGFHYDGSYGLQGCKILKRIVDKSHIGKSPKDQLPYILPYFDSDGSSLRDAGEYLIVDRIKGHIHAGSTEGYVWASDGKRGCLSCQIRLGPNEIVWVQIDSSGEYCCPDCYEKSGWDCDHCERHNFGDNDRHVVYLHADSDDSECVCAACQRNQTADCNVDSRRYYRSDMERIDGDWIHSSYVERETFVCRVEDKGRILNKNIAGYLYGKPISAAGLASLQDNDSAFMAGLSDLKRHDIGLSFMTARDFALMKDQTAFDFGPIETRLAA